MNRQPIVVGIQARMGSARLPGKSLADVAGKPLVQWVVDRCRLSTRIDEVWLLTTTSRLDDALAEAMNRQLPVFRGHETDVRSRYRELFELTGAARMVRITGDCPLMDGRLLDELINAHIESGSDYHHIAAQAQFDPGYPNGFNAEVFTAEAFLRMENLGDAPEYKEHVTWALETHPQAFRSGRLRPPPGLSRPSWKLSVDTAAELERIRQIVEALGDRAARATVADIVALIDAHPQWLE